MRHPDGIFGIFDVVRDFYEHGIDDHLWVLLLPGDLGHKAIADRKSVV